jgi:hypothetical protein
VKGNGGKKNSRASSSSSSTTTAYPLRTKIQTKIQVTHRTMWHLKHKASICIRSEILHDIHNLSPMEIVLAEDPMTAQSQLIENIYAG